LRSLYLRIWLTVVAVLALFALAAGWLVQRHLEEDRARIDLALHARLEPWGDLIRRSLPPADAASAVQFTAINDWSHRLRVPMALDDKNGHRITASESFQRREIEPPGLVGKTLPIRLGDGRTLWVLRFGAMRLPPLQGNHGLADEEATVDPLGSKATLEGEVQRSPLPPFSLALWPTDWQPELALAALLGLLFLAVAAGAYPVVRRLTRRLERLKQGVELFGLGALDHRVSEDGQDEVAAVASSFNRAASRIEALLHSHQNLLANASHELRSPLARLKMAVAMLGEHPSDRAMKAEIHTNIAELDALVEEVLLSSRLEAGVVMELNDPVYLLGLAVEEASRTGADVDGDEYSVRGSDRLLRRAVRNLLENARRYGGGDVLLQLQQMASGDLELRVMDRGPGVPLAERERIFEPFYRMPGHAEREGGVGLGLALVRQIAQRHEATVRCDGREGGGSCFTITFPAARVVREAASLGPRWPPARLPDANPPRQPASTSSA
jgi:signal transduction histidine kinase